MLTLLLETLLVIVFVGFYRSSFLSMKSVLVALFRHPFRDFSRVIRVSLLIAFFANTFHFASAQKVPKDATFYYDLGLKSEAEKKIKESIDPFLSAARFAEQGSELQLNSIYKLAYYYNYTIEKDRPEINGLTLLAIRNLLKSKRNDFLSARLFYRGGLAYERKYQADSALLCHEIAIKQFVKQQGEEGGEVSDCYRGIGNVYEYLLENYNSAESLYERALAIREKMEPSELTNFMIAVLYANLVEVNRKQRDLEKALFYELKNIGFAELLLKYPVHRENAYEGLAITYRDLGQLDKARDYYKKAIALNRETNHGVINPMLGDYYESLGELDEKEKLTGEAIKKYLKAVEIFRALDKSNDPNYIETLQRLGQIYSKEQGEKSLMYFKQAVELIRKYGLEKTGQASEIYKLVGDHFYDNHQIDSALMYYQNALIACSKDFNSNNYSDNPFKADIVLKDYAFEILLKKAQVMAVQFKGTRNVYHAELAIKNFILAEKLLSESRTDLDTDRSRWDFFDSNFELYEQAISFLFEANKHNPADSLVDLAFKYMENSKSKTLSDALSQAEFVAPVIRGDSLIQSLNAQKRRLHFLNDQFKKMNDGKIKNKVAIDEMSSAMIATDRSIQQIEEQLNDKYPSYLKTKYRNKTHSIQELQQYARHKNTTIIEYFWGTASVFSVGIDGEVVQFKRIGSIDSVENSIRAVLHHFSSAENDYSQMTVISFAHNSSSLYQIILRPFAELIETNEHLIIIPDGIIGQFPFEVLNTSAVQKKEINYQSLDYLVKKHFVSYSFSSAYLLNEKSTLPSEAKLLGFGFAGAKVTRFSSNNEYGELAGSEKEIVGLMSKFPTGEFFRGLQVTEKRFKEKASSFDILHLAVHGQGDTEQNYSASLFFRDSPQSAEDGKLNWYELFDMRLKAQLAVISSCESGIGKTYRGEGMLSMANAFAYAGCRNVVMGLWKVNDQVSVILMDSFYDKIRNGERVDDALTLAKRSYLEQGDELSSNPKMWAALVTYGNHEIVKKSRFEIWYIFAGLMILMSGLFLLRHKIDSSK